MFLIALMPRGLQNDKKKGLFSKSFKLIIGISH